jgi:hypothetical protein
LVYRKKLQNVMAVTPLSPFGQEKIIVNCEVNAKRGPRSEFQKMAKKKRFVAFGFALLLAGLLVALDFVLAARTVDQLARSEVYAGIRPASSVR